MAECRALRSNFERMLHLRARTFAPVTYFADNRNYSYKYSTINAKAETTATIRTYRQPFRRSRCLIPATGFYEPNKGAFQKSPYPWHCFRLKRQDLFVLPASTT